MTNDDDIEIPTEQWSQCQWYSSISDETDGSDPRWYSYWWFYKLFSIVDDDKLSFDGDDLLWLMIVPTIPLFTYPSPTISLIGDWCPTLMMMMLVVVLKVTWPTGAAPLVTQSDDDDDIR